MKIITFVNRKGGVGKSSLSCLLALYWAGRKDKTVAIKDYDPQGSSQAFVGLMENPNISTYTGGEDFDFLLIDTPGGIKQKDLNELVELSDHVIIPLCLSPTDIRSSTETAKLISNPNKARLLFNQVNSQTSAFKDRDSYAKAIGLKPLKSFLSKRVGFSYALIDGWSALNKRCVEELEQLAKEISK
jgi:chromosome partitioning protein